MKKGLVLEAEEVEAEAHGKVALARERFETARASPRKQLDVSFGQQNESLQNSTMEQLARGKTGLSKVILGRLSRQGIRDLGLKEASTGKLNNLIYEGKLSQRTKQQLKITI